MTRFSLSIVVAILLSAGCASTEPTAEQAAARDTLVCENITPTGSRLPQRVCRYQSDIENDKEAVDMLDRRMRDRGPINERRAGGTGSN